MTRQEKLAWLNRDMGIPVNIIAKFCRCHCSSIRKYIEGSEPTPRICGLIDEGIQQLLLDIKEVLER